MNVLVAIRVPHRRRPLVRKALREFFRDPGLETEFINKKERPRNPSQFKAFITDRGGNVVFVMDDRALLQYLADSGLRFGTLSFTRMKLGLKLRVRRVKIRYIRDNLTEDFLCWPPASKWQGLFGIVGIVRAIIEG